MQPPPRWWMATAFSASRASPGNCGGDDPQFKAFHPLPGLPLRCDPQPAVPIPVSTRTPTLYGSNGRNVFNKLGLHWDARGPRRMRRGQSSALMPVSALAEPITRPTWFLPKGRGAGFQPLDRQRLRQPRLEGDRSQCPRWPTSSVWTIHSYLPAGPHAAHFPTWRFDAAERVRDQFARLDVHENIAAPTLASPMLHERFRRSNRPTM